MAHSLEQPLRELSAGADGDRGELHFAADVAKGVHSCRRRLLKVVHGNEPEQTAAIMHAMPGGRREGGTGGDRKAARRKVSRTRQQFKRNVRVGA
jgi:hypothetical protein